MVPEFSGIDHVHVYVGNLADAERWYAEALGFSRVAELEVWNQGGGPLTLRDAGHRVHIALFESAKAPTSTIAFGADGAGWMAWLAHLRGLAIETTVKDHELAWSMYFEDPFGNLHEITTYECEYVSSRLGEAAEGSP